MPNQITMKTCWMLLLASSLYSQTEDFNQTKYLDAHGKSVSKTVFEKIKNSREFLIGTNDSLNVQKAFSERTVSGIIYQPEEIFLALERQSETKIDRDKPLVLFFYPGEDPCNSSVSGSTSDRTKRFHSIERAIFKISKSQPLYFYKSDKGLQKYAGEIVWKKDPAGILEKNFFNYHYPCSSFVVIRSNGKYVSYLGEHGVDNVLKALAAIQQ